MGTAEKRGQPWTYKEIEDADRMRHQRIPRQEIARRLGRTVAGVVNQLCKRAPYQKQAMAERRAEIRRFWTTANGNTTVRDIADATGFERKTVHEDLKAMGLYTERFKRRSVKLGGRRAIDTCLAMERAASLKMGWPPVPRYSRAVFEAIEANGGSASTADVHRITGVKTHYNRRTALAVLFRSGQLVRRRAGRRWVYSLSSEVAEGREFFKRFGFPRAAFEVPPNRSPDVFQRLLEPGGPDGVHRR